MSTLFSNQNPSDIKLERNTRGRPKKNSSAEIKKSLTMELIIDMLIKNEIYFNNYLTQRSSRWMVEEERLKFVEKAIKNQKNLYIYLKISDLKYIVSIEKLAEALSIMNEDFSNIEYLFYDEEMSQPEENGSKDEENDEEMYYTLNKKHKKKIELENEANLSIKKINCTFYKEYY